MSESMISAAAGLLGVILGALLTPAIDHFKASRDRQQRAKDLAAILLEVAPHIRQGLKASFASQVQAIPTAAIEACLPSVIETFQPKDAFAVTLVYWRIVEIQSWASGSAGNLQMGIGEKQRGAESALDQLETRLRRITKNRTT